MDKYVENPLVRLALVVLSTLRLTRFVTSDWLGEWTVAGPAKRWASVPEAIAIRDAQNRWEQDHDRATADGSEVRYDYGDGTMGPDWLRGWQATYDQEGPLTWQAKLVKGLDCPFCVGFWIGGLVLAGELLTRTRLLRWARPLWTFALAMLSLNEVVGHVSSRIDG